MALRQQQKEDEMRKRQLRDRAQQLAGLKPLNEAFSTGNDTFISDKDYDKMTQILKKNNIAGRPDALGRGKKPDTINVGISAPGSSGISGRYIVDLKAGTVVKEAFAGSSNVKAEKFEKAIENAVREIDKIPYDKLSPLTKKNLVSFIELAINDFEKLRKELDHDYKIAKRQGNV